MTVQMVLGIWHLQQNNQQQHPWTRGVIQCNINHQQQFKFYYKTLAELISILVGQWNLQHCMSSWWNIKSILQLSWNAMLHGPQLILIYGHNNRPIIGGKMFIGPLPTTHWPGSQIPTRGTGVLVVNQLLYHMQWPGDDTVGLGWWCWACLHEKNNQYLQVISAYWPCQLSGPLSTY